MKRVCMCSVLIAVTTFVYALDSKYAPIVNTALSDLKTHTKLSLLKGHVAVNISSGNRELDKQFAEAIQTAYPNFASKEDTVHHEDLYQMVVKVYRENSEVYVNTTVTNFEQKKTVERTVKVKSVSAAVLETLQYKTAIHAKNEFEAYLDSTFSAAGAVVVDAKTIPPPPPKPPVDLSGLLSHFSIGARIGSPMLIPAIGYLYWWGFTWGVIGINDAYPWNTDLWGPFTPGLVLNGNTAVSLAEFLLMEVGVDMGFLNPRSVDGLEYLSFFPYSHFLFGESDFYAGIGLGRMFTVVGNYERTEWPNAIRDSFAMDFIVQGELGSVSTQCIYRLDFKGGHYFNIMFGFYRGKR